MKKLFGLFLKLALIAVLGFAAWLVYLHQESAMDLIQGKAPTAY